MESASAGLKGKQLQVLKNPNVQSVIPEMVGLQSEHNTADFDCMWLVITTSTPEVGGARHFSAWVTQWLKMAIPGFKPEPITALMLIQPQHKWTLFLDPVT